MAQLARNMNLLAFALASCLPRPLSTQAAQERTGLGTPRRRQLGHGAHVIVLKRECHLLSRRMEARVAARHIQLARNYDLHTTYKITHCNMTSSFSKAAAHLLTGTHQPPHPHRPCSLHNALWSRPQAHTASKAMQMATTSHHRSAHGRLRTCNNLLTPKQQHGAATGSGVYLQRGKGKAWQGCRSGPRAQA